ncbi:MAG: hypothetical protein MUD08_14970, partial [Cytophagales bacterium]|nr:hypothetical protein [Cytophagales bacterium]
RSRSPLGEWQLSPGLWPEAGKTKHQRIEYNDLIVNTLHKTRPFRRHPLPARGRVIIATRQEASGCAFL